MKLHLPKGLLAVLLSCFVSTAAFTYGEPTITSSDGKTTVAMGTNDSQTTNPLVSGDTALEVNVNGTGVTWGSVVNDAGQVVSTAQVTAAVTATVNIAANASLTAGASNYAHENSIFTNSGIQTINVGAGATLTTNCSLAGWATSSPVTTIINLGNESEWIVSSANSDQCEYLAKTTINMDGAIINVAENKKIRSERGGNGANKFVTSADATAASTIQGAGSLVTQNVDITFDVAARTNKTDATEADLVVSTTLSGGKEFIKKGDGVLSISGRTGVTLRVDAGTLNLAKLVSGSLTNAGTTNVTDLRSGSITNSGSLNLGGSGLNVLFTTSVVNTGAVSILGGSEVAFSDAIFTAAGVTLEETAKLGRSHEQGNGFAYVTLTDAQVSALQAQAVSNSESGSTIWGDSLSWHNSEYHIVDATQPFDYTGASKLVVSATNGTVSLTEATSLDITVKQGASLDINGKKCGECDLVLSGGSLTNSGDKIESTQKQLNSLTLTANSTVNAETGKYYGVVAGGWGNTFIDLGGHILTKTGDGQFYAASTNLRGGGTLKITGGDFNLGVTPDGTSGKVASIGHVDDSADTNIWFTGGTLSSGKGINLNRNVEFLAKADGESTTGVTGTISAALNIGTNTATFKANSQNDKLIITGMISGSGRITVDGAGEVQYKNESTTGARQDLSNSVVEIKTSAKLNLLADYKSHTYLGGLTGDGTLQTSCASTSGQTDGYRATVISGDASGFTGVWELTTVGETSANRRVYGVLNTSDGKFGGVVKFTGTNVVQSTGTNTLVTAVDGSQLLLAKDSSIAGLQSDAGLTNAVVKGVNYTSSTTDSELRDAFTSVECKLTIAGNKNLSFSGKLDSLVSLVVGDGTNAASQTFDGATVGGSMELKKQATVTATGNTSIAALNGTGTLTASGGGHIQVNDASGFTGTLSATDAQISFGKASSLAAIHSSSALGVMLSNTSSSTVTVDEMVLAGTWVSVRYSESEVAAPVEATVITGSLTVSGTSTSALYANLELKANGTLQLDSALAMGSMLTLNSGITLANTGYVHISDIAKNTPITLFSSVDGVTYYDTDNQAQTLADGDSIDAGLVFGNINQNNRDFDLKFSGGNVLLVANNDVPEPTTATLSLLALMGLAARRRRKAAK